MCNVRLLLSLMFAALATASLTGCGVDAAKAPRASAGASSAAATDLRLAPKKDIAMQLVSSAENSSLDWRAQYRYIEDIDDGRGYTAGIVGFCSGTGDMLEVVLDYTQHARGNGLAKFVPALERIMTLPESERDTHKGLDPNFVAAWRQAANDPLFRQAQDQERDRVYFDPAVEQAQRDGLRALGQFIYYDAAVMHGFDGALRVRQAALRKVKPPARGGDEIAYLNAYLNARVAEMEKEEAHSDLSRVETEQRLFLRDGNLDLNPPLAWKTYGDSYSIGRS